MSKVELRYDPSQFEMTPLQIASSFEWIVPNFIGGYASSSILGANTRKYHGLLVAAMKPPLKRTMLLNKLEEEIIQGNRALKLSTNFYKDTIYPEGYKYLRNFVLSDFPCSLFDWNRVSIQKRISMIYQRNATIIRPRS